MDRSIVDYLRANTKPLIEEWERVVRANLAELAPLDRSTLIDHLPEVLEGLAAWLEGSTAAAERAFAALADGHALQRLGFGIEVTVVVTEYAWLRQVLLHHLLPLTTNEERRAQMLEVNRGLDRAIRLAVRRFSERREYLRDRFVGILGHDLRNPLSAGRLATSLLLASPTIDENTRRRLGTIARANERMERMIGDVLDFARSHLGDGIPARPAPCDVAEVCRLAVEEATASHPGRKIGVHVEGDLKGAVDRDRLLQALGNLITNAVQHGEDPISLEAHEAPDRKALLLTVTNHGEPIAPELLPRLFQPMARFDGSSKGGLGLGLFIAGQIVRAHGGEIQVESDQSSTRFRVRLPRLPLEAGPAR